MKVSVCTILSIILNVQALNSENYSNTPVHHSQHYNNILSSKLLIITYYWPPSGGAGVQRWLKFARYLPEYGWDPIILTVDPEYAAYPAIDTSLEKDIPDSVKVYRTRAFDYFSLLGKDKKNIPSAGFANNPGISLKGKIQRFIRGNFFIPDPRKGWNKYAFRKASEMIREYGIKNVITTSPPHSTQLIGLKLKKRFPDINWIADFRDPWTDIYYYDQFFPTPVSRYIDRRLEKKVIAGCDRLITVGPSLGKALSGKVPGAEEKLKVITNGYDENDFKGIQPSMPELFTITYIGTLSALYPIDGFLDSVKLIIDEGTSLKLEFAGYIPDNIKAKISAKLKNCTIEFLPYLDHKSAISHMLKSSALLLIIPESEGNRSILTGKLFEYAASGKPIICIGPVDGDAAGIICSHKLGETFNYSDSENIANYLKIIRSGLYPGIYPADDYSRKKLTAALSVLLR